MAAPTTDVVHGRGHDGRVDVEVVNNVAFVTFKLGEENRFNLATLGKMNAALDEVERNENVQALVTTSVGKYYSTGIDLPWLNHNLHKTAEFLKEFTSLALRIIFFPLPTIALLNGHAAAGGAVLALCHDIRIMREDRGFFYLSEVRIGIPFSPLMNEILRDRIPTGEAFTEAVVLGKRLPGQETKRLGIVSHVCTQSALRSTALGVAGSVLSQGPYNRTSMKQHKKTLFSHIAEAVTFNDFDALHENFKGALKLSKM